MDEREILMLAIRDIKKYLKEETDKDLKMGIYIALNTIRGRIIMVNEDLLKELGLVEDTEKYL